jgi:hypothetical protein
VTATHFSAIVVTLFDWLSRHQSPLPFDRWGESMEENFKTQEWVGRKLGKAFQSKRDWSLGQVAEIPFEVDVHVEISDEQLSTAEARLDVVYVVENAVLEFATELNDAFRVAHSIVRDAKVGFREGPELFPWLPWPDRSIQLHLGWGYLGGLVDVNTSLRGQSITNPAGSLASLTMQSNIWVQTGERHISLEGGTYAIMGEQVMRPLFAVELASISVNELTFTPGSIKDKLKATLRVVVAALPLISSVSGGVAGAVVTAQIIPHYQQAHEMKVVIQGQPCNTYTTWNHDPDFLRGQALAGFDFQAHGLTDLDRRMRACNVQLALKLNGGSPDRIDGVWGPNSQEALVLFAKQHKLPADIRSEALRGALQQVFSQRKSQSAGTR